MDVYLVMTAVSLTGNEIWT